MKKSRKSLKIVQTIKEKIKRERELDLLSSYHHFASRIHKLQAGCVSRVHREIILEHCQSCLHPTSTLSIRRQEFTSYYSLQWMLPILFLWFVHFWVLNVGVSWEENFSRFLSIFPLNFHPILWLSKASTFGLLPNLYP